MKIIEYGHMYGDSTGGLFAFLLVLCVILFILNLAIFEKPWVCLLYVAISIFLMVMKPILGTPYYKAVFDSTISPKEIFEQYDVLQVEYPYYYIRDGDEK